MWSATRRWASMASPAGYALHTGKPVISNHLDIEDRFRTPELLVQHGIRRAMNVILQGDGTPYGVLEVDSRSEGEFAQSDIVFLQGVANILGMAIERQRMEGNLRQALDRQQLLIKEVNHRVNNSLQIVASMLHLHASGAESGEVRHELRRRHQAVLPRSRGLIKDCIPATVSTRWILARTWSRTSVKTSGTRCRAARSMSARQKELLFALTEQFPLSFWSTS